MVARHFSFFLALLILYDLIPSNQGVSICCHAIIGKFI